MDRASLEKLLGQGLSLAEIGRRLQVHESTVGYWVQKHGLEAVNRERYAAKGVLSRQELEPLLEAGMSIAEIAEVVARSKSTVRHWLREYGLRTIQAERLRNINPRHRRVTLECAQHGVTEFQLRAEGGYRCLKCRSDAVARRRRMIKQLLVDEAGGACHACGYSRWVGALHFHHVDPSTKRFSLSHRGVARSLARARDEAAKCVLLCSNCHAEVESGARSLS